LDIARCARIKCVFVDGSTLNGVSTLAAGADLEMPGQEEDKRVALSASMIPAAKASQDETDCVDRWMERAIAFANDFYEYLTSQGYNLARLPPVDGIGLWKCLGVSFVDGHWVKNAAGCTMNDNATPAMKTGRLIHEAAVTELKKRIGVEAWEELTQEEKEELSVMYNLPCWAHLRCLFEERGIQFADKLLKTLLLDFNLDAFVGERLEPKMNSLLRSMQKLFNVGRNSYAFSHGNELRDAVRAKDPLCVICPLGRFVGERMDATYSNAVAAYLNRRVYIDYLARKIVFSSPNILEKSVFYRLSSKFYVAYLRATTIMWLASYEPMRHLCNANIKNFHLWQMAFVADTFHEVMQMLVTSPSTARDSEFNMFPLNDFLCLSDFYKEREHMFKRSVSGTLVDIKPALYEDLFDNSDPRLNELTDSFIAELAKGAIDSLLNGNGADWLHSQKGKYSKLTWTDERKCVLSAVHCAL
jgi:hypothetical protein